MLNLNRLTRLQFNFLIMASRDMAFPLGSIQTFLSQRYTYRVLQTIQMKLILLCVWAEPAVLGSAKTSLKFKYEI